MPLAAKLVRVYSGLTAKALRGLVRLTPAGRDVYARPDAAGRYTAVTVPQRREQ